MESKNKKRDKRKIKKGIVVSDRMDKTIVVKVYRTTQHSLYKKIIRKATKFKVHDGKNEAKVGDKVIISETRPISKEKRWRIVKILTDEHR